MKRFLVITPSPRNGDLDLPEDSPRARTGPRVYFGDEYDTLDQAKAAGALKAGIHNDPYYVLDTLGVQQPTYDPEIGWVAREDIFGRPT